MSHPETVYKALESLDGTWHSTHEVCDVLGDYWTKSHLLGIPLQYTLQALIKLYEKGMVAKRKMGKNTYWMVYVE